MDELMPCLTMTEMRPLRRELEITPDINLLGGIQKKLHPLSFVNFDLLVKMFEVGYSYLPIDRDSLVIDSK
jgi:hypothetical protein